MPSVRRSMKVLVAASSPLVSALLLAGCAAQRDLPCPDGMHPVKSELLYFGTASPRGPVTEEQWADFVDASVTPRFPRGLTVWRAAGQWQPEPGTVEREASYVLNVVHDGGASAEQAFAAIIDSYKSQFQQQAVLRVQDEVCANL